MITTKVCAMATSASKTPLLAAVHYISAEPSLVVAGIDGEHDNEGPDREKRAAVLADPITPVLDRLRPAHAA